MQVKIVMATYWAMVEHFTSNFDSFKLITLIYTLLLLSQNQKPIRKHGFLFQKFKNLILQL